MVPNHPDPVHAGPGWLCSITKGLTYMDNGSLSTICASVVTVDVLNAGRCARVCTARLSEPSHMAQYSTPGPYGGRAGRNAGNAVVGHACVWSA